MATVSTGYLLKKLKYAREKILFTFESLGDSKEIDERRYLLYKTQVTEQLAAVDLLEEKLANAYLEENVEDETVEAFNREISSFKLQTLERLSRLSPIGNSKEDQGFNLTPKIECPKFNEKDLEHNKLAFLNFYREFLNCVANLHNNALKLTVLKNHLSGYAFQLIKHLSVSSENYTLAIDLLCKEFLDENCIVDSIFASWLNMDCTYGSFAVKKFLNEVKTQVHELKNSFNIDFLEGGSPGNRLLSYIVFNKLPASFKSELVHKLDTNYPSLAQILDNSTDIIRTMDFCRNDARQRKVMSYDRRKPHPKLNPLQPSTLENFHVNAAKVKNGCCFCKCNNHRAHACKSYPSYADKKRRCEALKICCRCTSTLHREDVCPLKENRSQLCWSCKGPGHLMIMCPGTVGPNVLSNASWTNKSSSMLPVINISVILRGKKVSFNCLLDTGSERSYLCKELLQEFFKELPLKNRRFNVKTFLGNEKKDFKEIILNVNFPDKVRSVPFLIGEHLDLSFQIDGLGKVVADLQDRNVKLATDFSNIGDNVLPVLGLVGIDIIKYMGPMQVIKFRDGFAFELSHGLVLFGDVNNFGPCRSVQKQTELNYNLIMEEYSTCDITHVYFVMDSKSEYFDPWHCFDESAVERNVDKMFSLETLGIVDEVTSDYDKAKIETFRSSIKYRNNCYYVTLPWNLDKLDLVPSNYQVSLAVLDKVVKKLSNRGLYSDYCQVFLDQEKEGIIERINVPPKDFGKYTWIPHRPVFKNEVQNTTKIRPVFNCSLRTGGQPSLNDSAYSGVNLYTDMLEILFKFRTDRFVLLADIRKAFLMIKLENEFDQNKFCFFLKLKDKLVCFRYKSLIFGFVSSPFILSYIVKYHVEKHASGPCRDMLLNNFYVDNLVKTHQSPSELLQLYVEATTAMAKGGFELKTCCSNSELVSSHILRDGNNASHGMPYEKVLGYSYNPVLDVIRVAGCGVKRVVSTKRDILSVNSSFFDPLGIVLPVTIKGRIILSQLWKLGVAWDQPVPGEIMTSWNKFHEDLVEVEHMNFDRCAVKTNFSAILVIFCDASNLAYGIVEYLYQHGEAKLLYAKAKVAPSVKRTLPVLELLSVYLAIKHVQVLIKMFPVEFGEIIIAVDAQVVLSWLLSQSVTTKCQFTRNRLKDIKAMVNDIHDKGHVIKFRYVKTGENPADFVTRGVSVTKFIKERDFWLRGPPWLNVSVLVWPTNNLECLSEKCQELITAHTSSGEELINTPILRMDRFSSLSKVVRILTIVFQFISKLRRDNHNDAVDKSKLYLISLAQSQFFGRERNFLQQTNVEEIPPLVSRFNLFLDKKGLIRCRGRIDSSDYFSTDVKHPILLPKSCHITNLIIMDCHINCKHLGIAATLSKLRTAGFWLPKARQVIKKVLARCALCKRYNALSFKYPKITNLPKHRVNLVRPFLHTGIDFTGHLWVVDNNKVKKIYILIFTCFNVRAIHLELVPDMSTHSVVMAFLRFFNQFGVPSHIYSDNALSLVAGCDLMKKVFVSDEFKGSVDTYSIKHLTIPLYSAWFGAVWERLIKTIKTCLFKVIGRNKLDYFQLLTVLSDLERSINERPLTYRCSDDSSLELITPSAFIRPFPGNTVFLNLEEEPFAASPPNRTDLLESLKGRDFLLEKFKLLWYEEYLLSLRELSQDLYQSNFENKIKVDDVVLIKNFTKPRPYWSLARVMKLNYGNDGLVRSVQVKKGDGLQEHAIKHLYPLELTISHSYQVPPLDSNDSVNEEETRGESPSKPVRTRRSLKDRYPDYIWY